MVRHGLGFVGACSGCWLVLVPAVFWTLPWVLPSRFQVGCWLEVVGVFPSLSSLRSFTVEGVDMVLCQVLVGLPSGPSKQADQEKPRKRREGLKPQPTPPGKLKDRHLVTGKTTRWRNVRLKYEGTPAGKAEQAAGPEEEQKHGRKPSNEARTPPTQPQE